MRLQILGRSWPFLSAIALIASGCNTSSTHAIKVDAIAKPTAGEAQSYRIKSKDPRLGEENLRYREAADFIKTALSGKGMYEATADDRADVIVELEYGLDAPRTKLESRSVPIYAQVGGGVRYETIPTTDSRGNTTMRSVAVYEPPRSELVGYDEMMGQVTIYEKYLRITARENKASNEGRPPPELWSVHVSAEDESKDLRKYLPVMASATIEYIGKDSTNQKVVKVREDGPGVDFIRRGMPQSTTLAVKATTAPKT
ncbi:MAG: hypothetical protein ABIZ49_13255 [Opitutaceae bacterium]